MIRKLRTKFVCINMAFVTVMLLIIFGLVFHFTRQTMQMRSIERMRQIGLSALQPMRPGEAAGTVQIPFFSVTVSTGGELLTADGGYFDLSDRSWLQQITSAALSAGTETGVLKAYHLRFCNLSVGRHQRIVFADISSELATLRTLVYSCMIIGLFSLLAFLGISILLSRWAVRPMERAWQQQRQFIGDASHELKTPLAVIMTNAEMLQSDVYSNAERTSFSQRILSMAQQMRALVDTLLDMACVDNTSQENFSPVDFSQQVSDAVLSFQLLYQEQHMGLQCRIQENIHLQGNESQLYQVLDVLLDNALKYATPGGTVVVSLARHGRGCLLSVASPGTPISSDDLQNIFKRFYRIDPAHSSNGSYGLGLPIAAGIVTAHRGKIWAESKNGINTFLIHFPTL